MSPTIGSEEVSVQDPIVDYVSEPLETGALYELGWNKVSQQECLRCRGGESGLIMQELFIEQMMKLNPDFMDRSMAEDLIGKMERLKANVEGSLEAWEYLKGLKTVFVPEENRERDVTIIDAENIDRNEFTVTKEFTYDNGTKRNRADVVFLINGIPVLILEAKAAHKTDGMNDAMAQIRRYHRETPELMTLNQVYSITHSIQFFYSTTWNNSTKWVFNWKEEQAGNYEELIKSFFDRRHIIRMLRDYILFTRADDELKKVILRPHQMRAVQKIEERAQHDEKDRGLIWHTQGSGKTYSMIVSAQQLIENEVFENPTVLMLVDRNELETQLFQNLEAVGFEHLEVANTKKHLRRLLKDDHRGLIVSTIHKFDEMPAEINTRENIFVMIDEAHRTTGGKLGTFLMSALPNATLVGFTGTPIDKTSQGRSTFVLFGKDDPEDKYLDKYSIAESIEDGTTVELHYSLAPSEIRVQKEMLEEEFLNKADLAGISDVDKLNRVLDEAVSLRTMLKKPERIQQVAEYMVNHYQKFVEPMGYKAFLVGVDREACALYKKELDKLLPEEYSEVVYSKGHNDEELLAEYHLSDDKEKEIRKNFRKPDGNPKILIVTEKLLTGFDAPILYSMYLDKPMRDHVLLQAIARVNRPYEDDTGRKKQSGLVIDFVGIFDNLEKALAFDSSDIEGVIQDIEVLKEHFETLMETAQNDHLSIIEDKTRDKAIDAIVEGYQNEETRKEFFEFYRHVQDVYEIISPDKFLYDYLDAYENLSQMYRILKEAYEPTPLLDQDFLRKTKKLVQEHTQTSSIKPDLEVYEIDGETLKKLEESGQSDSEKVMNLIRSIKGAISDEKDKNPVLISIGEKAEKISERFRQKQLSTQEMLDKLRELVEEINDARKQKAEKNIPDEVFVVYWLFKEEELSNPEELANELHDTFKEYPYFADDENHERKIKQAITQLLAKKMKGEMEVHEIVSLSKKIMQVLKEAAR